MKIDYTVLIDMDGVLSDFDKGIYDITGKYISEISKKKMWKVIKNKTNNQKFFEGLDVMLGADELVSFIIANFDNFGVLTATGHTPNDSGEQKIKWIKKHFSMLSHNILTVENGNQKAAYANSHTILIDDRDVCTIPFIKAGGVGILHTDINMTINILGMILDD